MDPFTIGMFGMSFLEGIMGAGGARDQARTNMKSIDEQIDLLNKQREQLTLAYEQKKGITTESYAHKEGYLRETAGGKLEDIDYKYDVATSKTGLAFSGTVETGREREMDVLQSGYEFSRESLYDRLGASLLDIDMERADRFGQIESQITGLKGQRKTEEARSEDMFLGFL